MRKLTITILCLVAFIFTFFSCDSLVNSNGGVAAPNNPPTMRGGSRHSVLPTMNNGKVDLKAVPRFHINIQVKGALKPGEPIQISASVQADLRTKNAKIRLFLPEIHALKHQKPTSRW